MATTISASEAASSARKATPVAHDGAGGQEQQAVVAASRGEQEIGDNARDAARPAMARMSEVWMPTNRAAPTRALRI